MGFSKTFKKNTLTKFGIFCKVLLFSWGTGKVILNIIEGSIQRLLDNDDPHLYPPIPIHPSANQQSSIVMGVTRQQEAAKSVFRKPIFKPDFGIITHIFHNNTQ